jgi:hypothetical protein
MFIDALEPAETMFFNIFKLLFLTCLVLLISTTKICSFSCFMEKVEFNLYLLVVKHLIQKI